MGFFSYISKVFSDLEQTMHLSSQAAEDAAQLAVQTTETAAEQTIQDTEKLSQLSAEQAKIGSEFATAMASSLAVENALATHDNAFHGVIHDAKDAVNLALEGQKRGFDDGSDLALRSIDEGTERFNSDFQHDLDDDISNHNDFDFDNDMDNDYNIDDYSMDDYDSSFDADFGSHDDFGTGMYFP